MYFYSRVQKDWFAAIDYRRASFTVVSFGIMGMLICCKKKKWYTFPEIFCMLIHNASQCFMELGFFLTITHYDSYGVASLLRIVIQNN